MIRHEAIRSLIVPGIDAVIELSRLEFTLGIGGQAGLEVKVSEAKKDRIEVCEMVVATVLQAAQASLAVASTSRCRREGSVGAQCGTVVGASSRARRGTVSVKASSSSSDSKVGCYDDGEFLNVDPIGCRLEILGFQERRICVSAMWRISRVGDF